MKDAAFANRLCGVDFGVERYRVLQLNALYSFRANSASCGHSEHIRVDDKDCASQRLADADATSGDRLEHWLRVIWRLADDAENLGRRGFARQSLGQGLLEIRIRRRRNISADVLERRPTVVAELRRRSLLLLAPRTLHAESPPNGAGFYGRRQ
jgi:hypothetical protein